MKSETFKKGMMALYAAFPDKKMEADIFWPFLKDLNDEDFLRAVGEICVTMKELFPGTNLIATIRERALRTEGAFTAHEAFEVVKREMLRPGSYKAPKFTDPIIEKTVSAMGWRDMCGSDESQINTLRAQFIKFYESFKARDTEKRVTSRIPEMVNAILTAERKQLK